MKFEKEAATVLHEGVSSNFHVKLMGNARLLGGPSDFGTTSTGDPACNWDTLYKASEGDGT